MYARLLCRGSQNAARSAAKPGFTRMGEGATAVALASQKALMHSRRSADIGRAAASFRGQSRRVSHEVWPKHLEFVKGYTTRRYPKACFFSRGKSLSSPLGTSRPLSSTSQEGKGQEEEEGVKAEAAERAQEAGEGETQDEGVDEVVALREELANVEDQLKDAREKALYLAAEMENVRAIAKRDADSARLYAIQKFAKQLLDVADNLERAVTSGEGVEDSGEDSAHEQLLLGVKMTSEELQKVFRSQGLVKYGETGDTFDPHLHDAMFEYEDAAQTPGTVGQVLKSGYTLHGRVVRAAQVGTVKAA